MRVFSCPFLSPSLLLSGLFVRGFVSNRNLCGEFRARSVTGLRNTLSMALGNLSVVLPPLPRHTRFIIPKPPFEEKKTPFFPLIHPSIHHLRKIPPWVLLQPGFWGKHQTSPRFAPPRCTASPQEKEKGDNQPGLREEFICSEMLPCTLRTVGIPPSCSGWGGGNEPATCCPSQPRLGWHRTPPPVGMCA